MQDDDINAVRLAWVRRRMMILNKGTSTGNDGVIHVFESIDRGVSNFVLEDLKRSVSDGACKIKNYRELGGYGVTEPGYQERGAFAQHTVLIADLVDVWMLGL